MPSPQTLSETDRRMVAAWAADCAERVLPLFEAEAPSDGRPRDAIARARAFADGDLDAAGEIRRRFVAMRAAHSASSPAAKAAAWAAGQAAGVAHMGAHALGAAAYAAKAAGLAAPNDGGAAELSWQLEHMSVPVRSALQRLPRLGEDSSGPLGPGLLASGVLGSNIRTIQTALTQERCEPLVKEVQVAVDAGDAVPSRDPADTDVWLTEWQVAEDDLRVSINQQVGWALVPMDQEWLNTLFAGRRSVSFQLDTYADAVRESSDPSWTHLSGRVIRIDQISVRYQPPRESAERRGVVPEVVDVMEHSVRSLQQRRPHCGSIVGWIVRIRK